MSINLFSRLQMPLFVLMVLFCGINEVRAKGLCQQVFATKKRTGLYRTFEDLQRNEIEGATFRRVLVNRGGTVGLMAVHGQIDFLTAQLVREMAKNDTSYYVFESLLDINHFDLHITSQKFDEPYAMSFVRAFPQVISVHGYWSMSGDEIHIGGLDSILAKKIYRSLKSISDWAVHYPSPLYPATSPDNIVNRGRNGGVQLELSRPLRNKMAQDPELRRRFVEAIRAVF